MHNRRWRFKSRLPSATHFRSSSSSCFSSSSSFPAAANVRLVRGDAGAAAAGQLNPPRETLDDEQVVLQSERERLGYGDSDRESERSTLSLILIIGSAGCIMPFTLSHSSFSSLSSFFPTCCSEDGEANWGLHT
jgi:hypothetical protein